MEKDSHTSINLQNRIESAGCVQRTKGGRRAQTVSSDILWPNIADIKVPVREGEMRVKCAEYWTTEGAERSL